MRYKGAKPVKSLRDLLAKTKFGDLIHLYVTSWGETIHAGIWIRGKRTIYILSQLYDINYRYGDWANRVGRPYIIAFAPYTPNHYLKLPNWAIKNIERSAPPDF